jgi:predicted porin
MVAQADATLYGKFEMRVVDAENADLEVQSDDFRFGVKGDSEIAGGSKALFNLELEVNPDAGSDETAFGDSYAGTVTYRKAYVGATGDWGTALIGRIANPAEQIIGFTGNNSELTGPSDINPDHLGSAIAYVTPNMGGFTGYAAVVAEGEGTDTASSADGTLFGGSYSAAGLTVAAAYWSVSDDYTGAEADVSETLVGGSYTIDMTTIGLSYVKMENDTANQEDKIIGVRVDQKIGDLTLAANYFDFDKESNANLDNQFGLFAVYKLGAQAALDLEYSKVNADNNDAADTNILSLGYTVKF